jgi:hypothetical protein
MSDSTCRGCGQKIEWVKTNKGKNMPLDLTSYDWSEVKQGMFVINASGQVFKKSSDKEPSVPSLWRVSHFSTCPKADDFRR